MSVALTTDPSGPRIAMSGPDPAGRFSLWIGRDRATGIDADTLEAALIHLLARL